MNFPLSPIITFVVCAASVGWSVKVTKDGERDRAALEAKISALESEILTNNVVFLEFRDQFGITPPRDLAQSVRALESKVDTLEFDAQSKARASGMDLLFDSAKKWAGTKDDASGRKLALRVAEDLEKKGLLDPYRSAREAVDMIFDAYIKERGK
jgi:hypothetical protein